MSKRTLCANKFSERWGSGDSTNTGIGLPVIACSTSNGDLNSAFQSGSVVDDITLSTNNRIILNGQTDSTENGIYKVNATGAPVRDETETTLANHSFWSQQGTVNGDKLWRCINDTIVYGTTNIEFQITGVSSSLWKKVLSTLTPINTGDSVDIPGSGDLLEIGTPTNAATPAITLVTKNSGFAAPSNVGSKSEGDKWVFWNSAGVYKGAIGFNSREMWFQSTDAGAPSNRFKWFGGSAGAPVELLNIGDTGFVWNDSRSDINFAIRKATVGDAYTYDFSGGGHQFTGTFKLSDLTTDKGILITDGTGLVSSSKTLPNGTESITQPLGDNTKKVATTEFVSNENEDFTKIFQLDAENSLYPHIGEYNGTVRSVSTDVELVAAILASASYDIVELTANIVLKSTLVVDKSIKIDGAFSIESEGLSTDPTTLIIVTADNVYITENVSIKHKKTTNTSVEVAIDSTTIGFICKATVEFIEFGYVVGGSFSISGYTIYTGILANNHRHIRIVNVSAPSIITNLEYDFTSEATPRSNIIFNEATTSTEYFDSVLKISNVFPTDRSKICRQFYFQDTFYKSISGHPSLIFENNYFNDLNGGIGFIGSSGLSTLDWFDNIALINNTQGSAGSASYKGLMYIDGSGAPHDLGSTNLYYIGNRHLNSIRSDYTSAVDFGGVCYKNTVYTDLTPLVSIENYNKENSIYNYLQSYPTKAYVDSEVVLWEEVDTTHTLLKTKANTFSTYDTDQSNYLDFKWDDNDTANRVLNLKMNGDDRTLTLPIPATDVMAIDSGNYYDSSELEGVTQELGDSKQKQVDSGFVQWTSGTDIDTWIVIGNTFRLNRSGEGFIKSKKIIWVSSQVSGNLATNETTYIYIDSTGTLRSTITRTDVLYTDNIVLFEVLYDGSNYFVKKENHPYSFDATTSNFFHNNVGTVIRSTGARINRVATGSGSSADDRKLKTVGNDYIDDHGLSTMITETNPISANIAYRDSSSKWVIDTAVSEIPMQYNNSGTRTAMTAGNYNIFVVYVLKDDIKSLTPQFIYVMNETQFENKSAAESALSSGNFTVATNELSALEPAQLGYIIVNNSGGGFIDEVFIERSTFSSRLIGGGASTTDHHALLNLPDGDDHNQYAYLAGRSGGQVIHGGLGANDNIEINSTTNDIKGIIKLGKNGCKLVVGNDGITEISTTQLMFCGKSPKSSEESNIFIISSNDTSNAFQLVLDRTISGSNSFYELIAIEQGVAVRDISFGGDGRIGIGIAPIEKLTVDGNGLFKGNILFSNDADRVLSIVDESGASNAKSLTIKSGSTSDSASTAGNLTFNSGNCYSAGDVFGGLIKIQTGYNTFTSNKYGNIGLNATAGNVGIGTNSPKTKLDVNGGITTKVTNVDVENYTVTSDDYILNSVRSTTQISSINIPTEQSKDGRILIIKDAGFNAGTNKIILNTETGNLEGSAASLDLNVDGIFCMLYCFDGDWFFMGKGSSTTT